MLLKSIAVAATVIAVVVAAPAPSSTIKLRAIDAPHVLHERREYNHEAWSYVSPIPRDKRVPVRIGMTQSNLDNAHDLLMEV